VITDKIPLSLPAKYADLIRPLQDWARALMRQIEGKADGAQEAADLAQSDATLALSDLQVLAQANAASVKEDVFLRGWHG
jgi:hypothetical protein